MDRLARNLEHQDDNRSSVDETVMRLPDQDEFLIERSAQRLALPERLFNLNELEVLYQSDARALWTFMRPQLRPSFTPAMLGDFELWQYLIANHFGPQGVPLDYLILGSRAPGVFCFGGDLELFQRLIREGNRDGLLAYGHRCVEILHRNIYALDLPMITIGLVQGQALGGGFEAVLSFDFIIAERGATFGLPEIMFGLFPGMGAHAILSRKLGTAMAERMKCTTWASSANSPRRAKVSRWSRISFASRRASIRAWSALAGQCARRRRSASKSCGLW
jgi:DSF synthase